MRKKYFLGKDAKIYIGAAGSTPTTELKEIKELGFECNQTAVDVTTRASNGWSVYVAGLKDAEVSFDLLPAVGSAVAAMILKAFHADNDSADKYLAVKIVDHETEGLSTFEADVMVTQCGNNQQLDEAISYPVKLKPTLYDDTRPPTVVMSA